MDDNKDNFGFGENMPDPEELKDRHEINNDSLSIEPLTDESEHREIDVDDEHELHYWANEFQISVDELKAAVAVNGNSVRQIKKYLSV